MWINLKAALLGSVLVFSTVSGVQAAGLADDLAELMTSHERIKAAQADVDAAIANVEVARGDYYPTASVTSAFGNENISTASSGTVTSMAARQVDLSLTQTLYDFGATDASVQSSSLSVDQAKVTLVQTRQQVLLAALSAHLNLISAKRVLDFQRESEASIKRQHTLENARVERGGGLQTDELQAKRQLAGAQAQRVIAEGQLRQALNRYRAVFGEVPADLDSLEIPKISTVGLPASEEELVERVLANNPQIRVQKITADIADASVKSSKAAYYPTLEASAEQVYKRNVSGTEGNKNERLVKLEATYDFNFGWTAQNTLLASKSGLSAATSRLKDTRDQIEEQARNAWRNLLTTRETSTLRQNEANIAGEFLELARKERAGGTRTVFDVLAGETAHINALAAAVQAKTQSSIAAITILNIMGELDVSVLE